MSQGPHSTQVITKLGSGRVWRSWAHQVDKQRASYVPVCPHGDDGTEDGKQGELPPMWVSNLVEYPIFLPSLDGVTRHVFQFYTPTRQELEGRGLLAAPARDSTNPYASLDPKFLPKELAYRRLMATSSNKRLTTMARIDGGGNGDQYGIGGPYSGFRLPKPWHGKKSLLAHQMWAFSFEFEIEPLFDYTGAWGSPASCGRPIHTPTSKAEHMLDSVQMWLAHGQDKALMSYHFCFPDCLTRTFTAFEMTAIEYKGDFEIHSGQVMESRFCVKLRSRVSAPFLAAARQSSPVASRQSSPVASCEPSPVASRQSSPVASCDPSPVASRQSSPSASRQPSPAALRGLSKAVRRRPLPKGRRRPLPASSR